MLHIPLPVKNTALHYCLSCKNYPYLGERGVFLKFSHNIYLFGWGVSRHMSGQRVTAGVDLGSLLHHVCLRDWTHIVRLGCKLLTNWVTYCPHKEFWRIRGCSIQSLVSLRKEAFWLNIVAMMTVATAKRGSGLCIYFGKRMEYTRTEGHSFPLVATMPLWWPWPWWWPFSGGDRAPGSDHPLVVTISLVVTILWWWLCPWWWPCFWWKNLSFFLSSFSTFPSSWKSVCHLSIVHRGSFWT